MIDTEKDIIIGYVDDQTAVTDGGDFVARDDISLGDRKPVEVNREYPEADSTDSINYEIDQREEIRIEVWLDLHRLYDETLTEEDARKALGIPLRRKETLVAGSVDGQINMTEVASSAIIKAHRSK